VSAYQEFGHSLTEKLTQVTDAPSGRMPSQARVATPAFWGMPSQVDLPGRHPTPRRTSWTPATKTPISSGGRVTTSTHATPPRRLTATQQHALRQLRRLGAVDLGPGFSDGQLRGAFRALAKRFHPDRHPTSSSMERTRLAATFATLCEAYRELTSRPSQTTPAATHR
jgi:hypothetical protein